MLPLPARDRNGTPRRSTSAWSSPPRSPRSPHTWRTSSSPYRSPASPSRRRIEEKSLNERPYVRYTPSTTSPYRDHLVYRTGSGSPSAPAAAGDATAAEETEQQRRKSDRFDEVLAAAEKDYQHVLARRMGITEKRVTKVEGSLQSLGIELSAHPAVAQAALGEMKAAREQAEIRAREESSKSTSSARLPQVVARMRKEAKELRDSGDEEGAVAKLEEIQLLEQQVAKVESEEAAVRAELREKTAAREQAEIRAIQDARKSTSSAHLPQVVARMRKEADELKDSGDEEAAAAKLKEIQMIEQQVADVESEEAEPDLRKRVEDRAWKIAPGLLDDAARCTADEMQANIREMSAEVLGADAETHTLVYHFTELLSLDFILNTSSGTAGLRASLFGQLNGGLSVSLADPTALQWEQWAGNRFREKVGRDLWGEKWRKLLRVGNTASGEEVLENGEDMDKIEYLLVLKVPKAMVADKNRVVPGRDNVYIIPRKELTPNENGYHYLTCDHIKKVYRLSNPKQEAEATKKEEVKLEEKVEDIPTLRKRVTDKAWKIDRTLLDDAARWSEREMQANIAAMRDEVLGADAETHTLVYHFTELMSLDFILDTSSDTAGLRASIAGQLNGGLSVSLADPTALQWEQWAGNRFREKVGRDLWGQKWRKLLRVGNTASGEEVKKDGEDMDKIEYLLVLKVPKAMVADKRRVVPDRDNVYIIPRKELTPNENGYHYLTCDHIKKVYRLSNTEEEAEATKKEEVKLEEKVEQAVVQAIQDESSEIASRASGEEVERLRQLVTDQQAQMQAMQEQIKMMFSNQRNQRQHKIDSHLRKVIVQMKHRALTKCWKAWTSDMRQRGDGNSIAHTADMMSNLEMKMDESMSAMHARSDEQHQHFMAVAEGLDQKMSQEMDALSERSQDQHSHFTSVFSGLHQAMSDTSAAQAEQMGQLEMVATRRIDETVAEIDGQLSTLHGNAEVLQQQIGDVAERMDQNQAHFTDVCSSLEARLSSESATQADRLDQQADRLGQQQAHFTDVCSALDGKLSETTRALDSKLEAFMREGTA